MACGPSLYYNRYKNMSIEELKNLLSQLRSKDSLKQLMKSRTEELRRGIDDNSCVSNHNSQVEAIHILINYKTMYPNSDLSNCDDLFLIRNAIENGSGPVDKEICTKENVIDYGAVLDEFFNPPKKIEE